MTRFAIRSCAGSRFSSRAAVFVPLVIATLSLSSSTHAEEPPAAMESAPAADPAAAPVAIPATVATPAPAIVATVAPDSDLPRIPPHPERVHQGFYLRFTSGPSFVSLNGHGPSGSASLTDSGASGSIAIGGAIAPGLVLAGTIQGSMFNAEFKGGPFADATVSANGRTRTASNRASGGFGMAGVLVDWYPRPQAGWHTGISAGVGIIDLMNSADDSNFAGANLAGSVFGGYDWALGHSWALGLSLVASGATRTKIMTDPNAHDTGYRLTPVSVGVQASLLYF